jgi:small subunit ribosomal protein S3
VGQKVHPIGFRLGVIKDQQARWFSDKKAFTQYLHEDLRVRRFIMGRLADAGVSRVEIERSANQMTVTIHAAKPGIVIGKSGVKVEELRKNLEAMTDKKVRVTIQEIRQPELDAYLVARSIAEQLEKRVAFRRAMKQAIGRAMRFGAKGIRVQVSGRLGGAEMSRREGDRDGQVPLHTLRADIDFGIAEARTTYGAIGVKVWIYRGEVLPTGREPAVGTVSGRPAGARPSLAPLPGDTMPEPVRAPQPQPTDAPDVAAAAGEVPAAPVAVPESAVVERPDEAMPAGAGVDETATSESAPAPKRARTTRTPRATTRKADAAGETEAAAEAQTAGEPTAESENKEA